MIELVLAMFLVFLGAAFIMSLFVAGNRGFPRQHENTIRMSLAQAKMDEVTSLPYPYYGPATYRDRVLALDTPTATAFPAPYDDYTYDVDVTGSFQGSDRAHLVSVTVVSPNGGETTLRGLRSQAPATIDAGEALYEAYGCVGCHTLDHQPYNSVGETNAYSVPGAKGRVGPSHNLIGTRTPPSGTGTMVDYVKESVRDPDAYIVPGYEPYMAGLPLTAMPDEDLNTLAEWLVEVTTPPPDPPPPPPPPPPPTTGPPPPPPPTDGPVPPPPPPPPPPDPTCVDTTGTCLPGVY